MSLLLRSAASGELRNLHRVKSPVTGFRERTTLLEAGRTNLLLRSQEFDNAAWGKLNITVTPNAATAPDGTATADKVAATASAVTLMAQAAVVPGTTVTYSVYAKIGSGATQANAFALYNNTTALDLASLTINLATGVITQTLGSGAIAVDADDGWWRICIPVTSGITSGDSVQGYGCFVGGPETAGEYAYLWGAQLEVGPCASSYIPTVGAAVARAADLLYLPFTPVPQEMTVYCRFFEGGTGLVNNQRLWQISDAAGNPPELIALSVGAGDGYYVYHHNGVTDVSAFHAAVNIVVGDLVEVRAVLAASGAVLVGISVNGAAEVVAGASGALAPAPAWSAQRLYPNGLAGSDMGINAFSTLVVLSGTYTLAECRRFAGFE